MWKELIALVWADRTQSPHGSSDERSRMVARELPSLRPAWTLAPTNLHEAD